LRTAILGAGKMGIWYAKYLKEKGDTIVLAARDAEKLQNYKLN
jgi:ketopantoate reductase